MVGTTNRSIDVILHMIAKEGLPGLQRPIPPRHHVDRNRGLGDLDAQFEQFAMDPRSAPERVLQAHSSDQIAHLFADPRSAPGRTGLPSPVGGKTHTMPSHDGPGPDDGYGVQDVRTAAIEPDQQRAVSPTQMQSTWRAPLQDIDLLPQYQDFGFEPPSRLEMRTKRKAIAIIDRHHVLIRSIAATPGRMEFSDATTVYCCCDTQM